MAVSASSVRNAVAWDYRRLVAATFVSNLGDGVGRIAYPWLATALTRDPLLVSLIAVVQYLPWLAISLPAGVIVDRTDRRRVVVLADSFRGLLTLLIAVMLLVQSNSLASPDQLDQRLSGTNLTLYSLLIVATLLLGAAEVFRDTAAQTLLPELVETNQLEKANGRLWSAEVIANNFVGRPLGAALLAVGYAAPFLFDSATFFAAAALVAVIAGLRRPAIADDEISTKTGFRRELVEGFRWLRDHQLLWTMAVVLGFMNGASRIFVATYILFAQEIMGLGPSEFAVVSVGGALGAVAGGGLAHKLSQRLGTGHSLMLVLSGLTIVPLTIGLVPLWQVAVVLFAVEAFLGLVWNVVTVSFRQAIVPEDILGRVNGVYRFISWGTMPLGALAGGLLVLAAEQVVSRDFALRVPWFTAAAIHFCLLLFSRHRLTSHRIDGARREATANSVQARDV